MSAPALSRFQLALSSALSPFAMVVVAPLLPMLGRTYHVDPSETQYVISVYLLGLFVAQLVLGSLSDRFGRRRILIPSLVLYAVMSVVCAYAPNFQVLVAARFLQACGAAGTSATARASVHDVYRGDTAARYMTFIAMGHSLAHTLAPMLGGFVGEALGIAGTFLVLTGLGVVMMIWAFTKLPETRKPPADAGRFSVAHVIYTNFLVLKQPLFFAYAAVYGLTGAGFFAFLAVAPTYFDQNFGISGPAFGLYWSYMSIAFLIAAMYGARLVARFGRRTLFNVCLGLGVLVGFAMPVVLMVFGPSPLTIVTPMIVSCGLLGITSPLSLSGAIASQPNVPGTASGLCGSLSMAYAGLFTIVSGLVYNGSAYTLVLPMGLSMSLMALGAIAIAWLEKKTPAPGV